MQRDAQDQRDPESAAASRAALIQRCLDLDYDQVDPGCQVAAWLLLILAVGATGLGLYFALLLSRVTNPRPTGPPLVEALAQTSIVAVALWVMGAGPLLWFRRSRAQKRARLRECLVAVGKGCPGASVVLPHTPDRELLEAGWRLVHWLEATYLTRSASVCLSSPNDFWMAGAPRVSLDGVEVGTGEEEAGFDIPLTACPGRHLLELRTGKKRWRNEFTIPGPGQFIVMVKEVRAGRISLEVTPFQHDGLTPVELTCSPGRDREQVVADILHLEYLDFDRRPRRDGWVLILFSSPFILCAAALLWSDPRPWTGLSRNLEKGGGLLALGGLLVVLGLSHFLWYSLARILRVSRLKVSVRAVSERWGGAPGLLEAAVPRRVLDADDRVGMRRQDTETLRWIDSAWRLVRWLEDTHLTLSATIRIEPPGRRWVSAPLRVFLDGACVGEGPGEPAFDVPLRVCPGKHHLEVASAAARWRAHFTIPGPGEFRIEIIDLHKNPVPVNVRPLP
jgi:hypothetical protein